MWETRLFYSPFFLPGRRSTTVSQMSYDFITVDAPGEVAFELICQVAKFGTLQPLPSCYSSKHRIIRNPLVGDAWRRGEGPPAHDRLTLQCSHGALRIPKDPQGPQRILRVPKEIMGFYPQTMGFTQKCTEIAQKSGHL